MNEENVVYKYNIILLSNKKKEILPLTTKMNLEDIMLSK